MMKLFVRLFYILMAILVVGVVLLAVVSSTSVMSRVATGLMMGSFVCIITALTNYYHLRQTYFERLALFISDVSHSLEHDYAQAKTRNMFISEMPKPQMIEYAAGHEKVEDKMQEIAIGDPDEFYELAVQNNVDYRDLLAYYLNRLKEYDRQLLQYARHFTPKMCRELMEGTATLIEQHLKGVVIRDVIHERSEEIDAGANFNLNFNLNGIHNHNHNLNLKASRVMLKMANRAVGNGKSRTFAIVLSQ